MGDYLGLVYTNLMAYVFGNPVYFGTFLLIFVTILMYRLNLGIDAMLVVWIPILYMMAWSSLGISTTWMSLLSIVFLGGLLIVFGMKFVRR